VSDTNRMSDGSSLVRCGECETLLDEASTTPVADRKPCPNCGSLSREISVTLSETIVLREKLKLKGLRTGLKRPFVEQISGDDLHRKTGRWMRLERVIDRVRNWYREIVTDPETAQVIHRSEEPLTEHRGHGSAKNRERSDLPPDA